MTQMQIVPLDPSEELTCETCGQPIEGTWVGQVDEYKLGVYQGYSLQCLSCLNVLARMADALDDLEGPGGNKIELGDETHGNKIELGDETHE
jgi:hypothetical protein